MACVQLGRNPTTQYLHRTRRVSVQRLRERCCDIHGAPVEIKLRGFRRDEGGYVYVSQRGPQTARCSQPNAQDACAS
eukprot:13647938-Alexandrium_andersonii.AAC.1